MSRDPSRRCEPGGRLDREALALLAPAAQAAPPANDDREAAVILDPPVAVAGTTAEATLQPGESPRIDGVEVDGSVWYRVGTASQRRIVQDAAIELVRRARSQDVVDGSALTDEDGRAELDVVVRPRRSYFIRVARRANSVAGPFRLEVFVPDPLPRRARPAVARSGATDAVDPLGNTADVWSTVLRPGITYRLRLVNRSSRRLGLLVFPPGTANLEGATPVGRARSYQLFTPGPDEGGRYTFLVISSGRQGRQPYRLLAGRAGLDDLWPGRLLRNFSAVRGTVSEAGLDVVDTYRFDLASRSAVTLDLRPRRQAPLALQLLRAGGKRLGGAAGSGEAVRLKRTLRPGRYVVRVRGGRNAGGPYTLRRAARTVTRLLMTREGTGPVAPGSDVVLRLHVRPGVSGAVAVVLERFDPATGWHYVRTLRTRIASGAGAMSFRPPFIGRWRARAVFEGTRTAEPSVTRRDLHWTVGQPLPER